MSVRTTYIRKCEHRGREGGRKKEETKVDEYEAKTSVASMAMSFSSFDLSLPMPPVLSLPLYASYWRILLAVCDHS
jgi:hypothetical protein